LSRNGARVCLALLAWLSAATAAGWAGFLERTPTAALPAALWGLVAVLVLLFWRWSALREWVLFVDLRVLVGFHLVRFVGFYFLYLYDRGALPYAFAVPGGWGDNVVAAGALLLIALVPPFGRRAWWLYLLWNTIGLLDILAVVTTAARLAFDDRASMAALLALPLSLLPTFIVPIVIATHLFIFYRLFGQAREPQTA